MVFVCGSVLIVSAKNTSSSKKSVAVSKKVSVAKTKAKAKALAKARALANSVKDKCENNPDCAFELAVLVLTNAAYESYCAPNYELGCAPALEYALIGAAIAFESCMYSPFMSKNKDGEVDRYTNKDTNINRKKMKKSRDVTSR